MNQRLKNITILLLTCWFFYSCNTSESHYQEIFNSYEAGRFSEARQKIDQVTATYSQSEIAGELEILRDRMDRIELDFSKTEAEIRKELLVYFDELTTAQMNEWETSGKLEMRVIDGTKRYFRNAVPNLFRVDSMAEIVKIKKDGIYDDPLDAFCLENTASLVKNFQQGLPTEDMKQKFRIEYTITLQPDAVPANEQIRCWMPYPRESLPRQSNVKLLSVNSGEYQVADNSTLQRSLYMEKVSVAGEPTVFSFSAEFETVPQWIPVTPEKVQSYDTSSELYQKYTAERPPHLIFSEEIKSLAREITRDLTNPVDKVKAIYYWIDQNIPWASALEYSTFECIPQYVLENKKGDCGMQTLLFMSLARYSGIPCKWQSGWMLHPGEVNLHDWCEVYYEGIGWVPLDQSFGLQESEFTNIKEFYISGLDAYRLIVNDDFSREFDPPKKYYRSEPIDFQRGELEWSGGNLYFDKWSYNMKVTSIKETS